MNVRAALEAAADGVLLSLEVTPDARDARFPAGYNPWRKRILARVRAPPEDGAANDELRRRVADALDVPREAVVLVAGATSRQKRILVRGRDLDDVVARLERT